MSLFSFLGPAIGLATSIFGGNAQKKAADKAAQLQYQSTQDAIAEQRRQFDLNRSDYAPWQAAGAQAVGQQGDLLGLNGSPAQAAIIEALRGSPLYQSLYRNGEEALLQTAAATGGLRGGNTQRGLADFGADTLASVIQRQLANLGGLSGQGQAATSDIAQLGQAGTQNIMQQINAGANAQAGAALTRGGINAGIWNNIGSFLKNDALPAFGKLF